MATARLIPTKLSDGRLALRCEGQVVPGNEYRESEPELWRSLLRDRAGGWSFEFRSRAEQLVEVASQIANGDVSFRSVEKSHPSIAQYIDSRFDLFCEREEIDPPPPRKHLRLEIAEAIAHGEVDPCSNDEWGLYTSEDGVPADAIAALGALPTWVRAGNLPAGGYGLLLENGRRIADLIEAIDPHAALDPDAHLYEPPQMDAPRLSTNRTTAATETPPPPKKPRRLLH